MLCRQRRGLVPVLVIGSLVMLILLTAVIRAAASTRGEHKGALCFLSKLGVQIGQGCGDGPTAVRSPSKAVAAAISDLVEATPRVKDVQTIGSVSAELQKSSVGRKEAVGKGSSSSSSTGGGRRLSSKHTLSGVRWGG